MKHIESIQSEYAADDMTALLVNDATASAALNALLRLVTGCAIPQTSDLPQSEVEELVPLCLSILRRHWTTPLTALGDGTTPMSLADLLRQLILGRVDGNEEWSIPSATISIADAVSALRDRKIGGIPQAADGISIAQILMTDKGFSFSEISDNNIGWTFDRIPPKFANVTRLRLGCSKLIQSFDGANFPMCDTLELPELEEIQSRINYGTTGIKQFNNIETLVLPKLKYLSHGQYYTRKIKQLAMCKSIIMPNFEEYSGENGDVGIAECPLLEEIYAPNSTYLHSYENIGFISQCPSLKKIILGDVGMNCGLYTTNSIFNQSYNKGTNMPNLMHFEFGHNGQKIEYNLGLSQWSPAMALRTDTTAEDYVDLREDITMENNLEQFLWNFQTYIADRLADRTGQTKLTITLSAAVYEALEAQEGQTILATLTNKNWDVAQA